ncbi:hypothetical protein OAF24_00840 [bacterium]|nr:hypothetical protein [bacterium]
MLVLLGLRESLRFGELPVLWGRIFYVTRNRLRFHVAVVVIDEQ